MGLILGGMASGVGNTMAGLVEQQWRREAEERARNDKFAMADYAEGRQTALKKERLLEMKEFYASLDDEVKKDPVKTAEQMALNGFAAEADVLLKGARERTYQQMADDKADKDALQLKINAYEAAIARSAQIQKAVGKAGKAGSRGGGVGGTGATDTPFNSEDERKRMAELEKLPAYEGMTPAQKTAAEGFMRTGRVSAEAAAQAALQGDTIETSTAFRRDVGGYKPGNPSLGSDPGTDQIQMQQTLGGRQLQSFTPVAQTDGKGKTLRQNPQLMQYIQSRMGKLDSQSEAGRQEIGAMAAQSNQPIGGLLSQFDEAWKRRSQPQATPAPRQAQDPGPIPPGLSSAPTHVQALRLREEIQQLDQIRPRTPRIEREIQRLETALRGLNE